MNAIFEQLDATVPDAPPSTVNLDALIAQGRRGARFRAVTGAAGATGIAAVAALSLALSPAVGSHPTAAPPVASASAVSAAQLAAAVQAALAIIAPDVTAQLKLSGPQLCGATLDAQGPRFVCTSANSWPDATTVGFLLRRGLREGLLQVSIDPTALRFACNGMASAGDGSTVEPSSACSPLDAAGSAFRALLPPGDNGLTTAHGIFYPDGGMLVVTISSTVTNQTVDVTPLLTDDQIDALLKSPQLARLHGAAAPAISPSDPILSPGSATPSVSSSPLPSGTPWTPSSSAPSLSPSAIYSPSVDPSLSPSGSR